MRHYGTVQVPGIQSVCYKIGMRDKTPAGFWEVGNGTSYKYVTDYKPNPDRDTCQSVKVNKGDGLWDVPQDSKWAVGKTRRELNATFRARDAKLLSDPMADTVRILSSVGFEIELEFIVA
jgi:hypothetical protein